MLPEHPPSQDKQPIEKMKGTSDDMRNHLFPMVVQIVSPRVEIVGQGGLWESLLNQRSILKVKPLGEHVFEARHTRWNSSPPNCQLPRSASELLHTCWESRPKVYLHRSNGPVEPCGFEVKEDHSWTSALSALLKLLASSLTWHISGRQAANLDKPRRCRLQFLLPQC